MKTLFLAVFIVTMSIFMTLEAGSPPPARTNAGLAVGEDCTESKECDDGLCEEGKCADPCVEKETGKEVDEECEKNDDCKSRICKIDKCEALPICPPRPRPGK